MAQNKMILYSYFRSSCSYRVRIALNYKGVNFEHKTVNLVTGEHLKDDFLRLSPCGEVPVLVDQGRAISHSSAILEYLEETVPGHPLLPSDPFSRAQVRGLVDALVSGIQPLQNMKVLKHIGVEKSNEWAKHWVESGFKAVEHILQETHGAFCFGDEVTLADVCLVPQVFNANRFKVDMTRFPLIQQISDRLEKIEAFRAAHPFLQPDCPPELRV